MWIVVDYRANDDEEGWQACNPPNFQMAVWPRWELLRYGRLSEQPDRNKRGERHRILDVSSLTR